MQFHFTRFAMTPAQAGNYQRAPRMRGLRHLTASAYTVGSLKPGTHPPCPTEHARLLFAAAKEPKKLLIFPGAGHNVFGSLGDGYLDTVADFVESAIKTNH